jgi:hypothetical protein
MDTPSSYDVVIAGHRARLQRDGLGYFVTFDDPLYGEVRAIGFASVALATAEAHVRGVDERLEGTLAMAAPRPAPPPIDTAVRLLDLFDDDHDEDFD